MGHSSLWLLITAWNEALKEASLYSTQLPAILEQYFKVEDTLFLTIT
jgi:hypothetical protein